MPPAGVSLGKLYFAPVGTPLPRPRPARSNDGERARRIVRNGLADVLAWLGKPVGPAVDDPYPGWVFIGDTLSMSVHVEARAGLSVLPPGGALRIVDQAQ